MNFTKKDFEEFKIVNTDLYLNWFNLYCVEFKINTADRLLCFLPNLLHESNNFEWVKEILPKNNPIYVKKLGNYFGRGLMQVTHQKNYKLFNDWCNLNIKEFNKDFIKNPELLQTPQYAVLSAFWFWKSNNLEKYADRKDFLNVCSLINTGRIQKPSKPHKINGLDDRIKKYAVIEKWCIKNKIT